jgi:hypothetical protein
MKKLESFVHVSTAYCHCHEAVLHEKHYPVNISPETIIKIIDELPEDIVTAMSPKLLGEQPNTYAFTKSLGEDLVNKCGLPAGIIRPSIGKEAFHFNNITKRYNRCLYLRSRLSIDAYFEVFHRVELASQLPEVFGTIEK